MRARRSALSLLVPVLVGVCAAIPAAATAAPSFLAPASLSLDGDSAYLPQVAVGPNGDAVAAWIRNSNSGYVVQAATRPAGGAWSAAQTVSAANARDPQVAVDAAGNAIVVFDQAGVRYADAPAGHPFGATQLLSSETQATPQVAMDAAGDAFVAFVAGASPNVTITTATRPAGGTFAAPQPVSTSGRDPYRARIAADRRGDVIVAWTSTDATSGYLEDAYRPAGGTWGAAQTLDTGGKNISTPDVAIADDGSAVASWLQDVGTGYAVRAATDVPGAASSPVVTVGPSAELPTDPTVAVGPNGSATVVWTDHATTKQVVRESTRTATGQSFSAAATLSPPAEGADFPVVVMGPSGRTTVVWQSAVDPSTIIVRATTRDVPTGSFAASTRLTATGELGYDPQVDADADGDAMTVWRGDVPGINSYVIRAAGLDAAGPQLRALSVPASGITGSTLTFSTAPLDVFSSVASTTWDFGDGATASGTAVTHAYGAPGSYTAKVTATDGLGNVSSAQRTVAISVPPAGGGDGGLPNLGLPDGPRVMTGHAETTLNGDIKLTGTVDTHGKDVTVVFDYGKTPSYGASTHPQFVPAASKAVDVSAFLSGLPAGDYHFRIRAITPGSVPPGADVEQLFGATAYSKPPTCANGKANTVKFGKDIRLDGCITGGTRTVAGRHELAFEAPAMWVNGLAIQPATKTGKVTVEYNIAKDTVTVETRKGSVAVPGAVSVPKTAGTLHDNNKPVFLAIGKRTSEHRTVKTYLGGWTARGTGPYGLKLKGTPQLILHNYETDVQTYSSLPSPLSADTIISWTSDGGAGKPLPSSVRIDVPGTVKLFGLPLSGMTVRHVVNGNDSYFQGSVSVSLDLVAKTISVKAQPTANHPLDGIRIGDDGRLLGFGGYVDNLGLSIAGATVNRFGFGLQVPTATQPAAFSGTLGGYWLSPSLLNIEDATVTLIFASQQKPYTWVLPTNYWAMFFDILHGGSYTGSFDPDDVHTMLETFCTGQLPGDASDPFGILKQLVDQLHAYYTQHGFCPGGHANPTKEDILTLKTPTFLLTVGQLKALGFIDGSGFAEFNADGFDAGANVTVKIPVIATVHAIAHGWASYRTGLFDFSGGIIADTPFGTFGGFAEASNKGVEGCGYAGSIIGHFGGYVLANGKAAGWKGSCGFGAVHITRPTRGFRQATAPQTVTFTGDAPRRAIDVHGVGGDPIISIDGPHGEHLEPDPSTHALLNGQGMILPVRDGAETFVVLPKAAAGTWRVTPLNGSVPISTIEYGNGLPEPKVSAKVAGHGTKRRLTYAVTPIPGQSVQFVERTGVGNQGAGHPIGRPLTVSAPEGAAPSARRRGALAFRPQEAAVAGRHTIEAVVSILGRPWKTLEVARFTPPAPPKAGRVHRLRATFTRAGVLRVTWRPARSATAYDVLVRGRGGMRFAFHERRTALTARHLDRLGRVRVAVRAIRRTAPGAPAVAVHAAPARRRR